MSALPEITLTISNYRCFSEDAPAKFTLSPGGLVAFVGLNNAGKSTLLRFFYELRAVFSQLALNGVGPFMGNPVGMGEAYPPQSDPSDIFFNGNDHPCVVEVEIPIDETLQHPVKQVDRLRITIPRSERNARIEAFAGPEQVAPSPEAKSVSNDGYVENHKKAGQGTQMFSIAAITTAMRCLTKTCYLPAFRNTLPGKSVPPLFDMQVGGAFNESWRGMKGGTNRGQQNLAIEVEGQLAEMFEFGQLHIQNSSNDASLQLTIDRRPFRMDELGAGLTHVLLVLTTLMIRRHEIEIILVDEPEINLHASLQLKFLQAIQEHATHSVVFATHNLFLARAAGASVYSVARMGERGSQRWAEVTAGEPLVLGELAFGTFKEYGFRRVVLVEGKHDVPTFRELLSRRQKSHDALFISLGGGLAGNDATRAQLSELRQLSNEIHALVDSERADASAELSPRHQDFAAACRAAGICVKFLDRRAIENYFTPRAVEAATGVACTAIGPYDTLDGRWSKADNYKIARATTWEEIADTDLGQFIENL
jgi:ABC-type lipoprotein export system ATPase subunit